MAQNCENVGASILGEFVDDAGAVTEVHAPNGHPDRAAIEAIIIRIANDMRLPDVDLEQIAARVAGAVGPTVEERVRAELERVAKSQQAANE